MVVRSTHWVGVHQSCVGVNALQVNAVCVCVSVMPEKGSSFSFLVWDTTDVHISSEKMLLFTICYLYTSLWGKRTVQARKVSLLQFVCFRHITLVCGASVISVKEDIISGKIEYVCRCSYGNRNMRMSFSSSIVSLHIPCGNGNIFPSFLSNSFQHHEHLQGRRSGSCGWRCDYHT